MSREESLEKIKYYKDFLSSFQNRKKPYSSVSRKRKANVTEDNSLDEYKYPMIKKVNQNVKPKTKYVGDKSNKNRID